MSLIRPTTLPIRWAASASAWTVASVLRASATTEAVMVAVCCTWRLISPIDAVSCSVEAATVCTLLLVASAATETVDTFRLVWAATCDIWLAVACSSVEAEAKTCTMPPILCSKLRTSASTRSVRCALAACSVAWAAARRCCSTAFALNTSTARAMSPISSRPSRPGTSAARLPRASSIIDAVMAVTGRVMLRPIRNAINVPAARQSPASTACRRCVEARMRSVTPLLAS